MIAIKRTGTAVELKFSLDIFGTSGYTYNFNWECGDKKEDYAQLLVNAFNQNLRERIKDIRRSEYYRGWKDAKAKTRKTDRFAGNL